MSDLDEPQADAGGPAASEPGPPPSSDAEETEGESPHDTWKVDEQGDESFPASDPPG